MAGLLLIAGLIGREVVVNSRKPPEVPPSPVSPAAEKVSLPSILNFAPTPAVKVEKIRPSVPVPAPRKGIPPKNAARPRAIRPMPPLPRAVVPNEIPAAPITPPAPEPLEWKGNDTSITHSGQIVIRNDHQWVQFWAEHHPHEPAPDVDFTKNSVIGVFLGSRPADAFAAMITSIRTLPESVVVEYRELVPPPGTVAIDVTVYPYHLKVIPKTTLPVKFTKLNG
jgi:hypothetical protein